jgi:hypothetical protein
MERPGGRQYDYIKATKQNRKLLMIVLKLSIKLMFDPNQVSYFSCATRLSIKTCSDAREKVLVLV